MIPLAPWRFRNAIGKPALAAGDFDVAALLTDTVGLDDVPDVFARLATSPHDAKILLHPTRSASRTPNGKTAGSPPAHPR